MAIPFILLSPSLFFFIPLWQGVNLAFEGDNSLLQLLLITEAILRHTNKPTCTGQIAFTVFQALFAITQLLFHVLLFHVSTLLTSACKQANYISA